MDDDWLHDRAHEMRTTMEEAEAVLWSGLKGRSLGGFKFRRQYVAVRSIVDFYCVERRLAVEVDGEGHDSVADEHRDAALGRLDISVVRFTNDDVFRTLPDVLATILSELRGRPIYIGGRKARNP